MSVTATVASSTIASGTADFNVTVTSTAVHPAVLAPRGWSQGDPRSFVALTIDVGYLYLRPRAAFGYGKPHSTWVGLEVNPIFALSGLGAYAGVKGQLPFIDLRVGARYFYALERSYLEPRESYDRLALAIEQTRRARYLTLESELNTSVPLGPGELAGLASISSIQGVPDDIYLYEETLKIIAKPPWVWRARLGYSILFPVRNVRGSIGAVVDVLGMPGRDTQLVRAGLVFRVAVSSEIEVRGTFVPTIYSRDEIGIMGGDFTELGLRWRWATGR